MMQLADFEFVQLTQDTDILPFLSEDEDLNNFLTEDAKNYSADLMAVTYLFIDKEKQQTVAYFSLLNDKVAYDPAIKRFGDESIVVYTIVNVVAATLLQKLVVWRYPKNMLEGANFRNAIGELHYLLENHHIHNQDRRITFTDIVLGKNPDNIKEDSYRGIGFRVQYGNGSGTDTHTHSLIKRRDGSAIFTKTQEDHNLSELKACPDYAPLPDEYKRRLVRCYELVTPDLTQNLLTGFDVNDPSQYYEIGQFKFIKDREYIAKGLIEILYNMRNSLFHGELIPNKEANKIYSAAYKILRELIEAL